MKVQERKIQTLSLKVFVCDHCDHWADSKAELKDHIHCVKCAMALKIMPKSNGYIHYVHVCDKKNANKLTSEDLKI